MILKRGGGLRLFVIGEYRVCGGVWTPVVEYGLMSNDDVRL